MRTSYVNQSKQQAYLALKEHLNQTFLQPYPYVTYINKSKWCIANGRIMNDMNFHMNHIKLFQFVVVFVVISVSPNLKGPIKNTHLLNLLPQTKIHNFYLHLHTPKVFFANSIDVVEGKINFMRIDAILFD
jgi:hypothetical protein